MKARRLEIEVIARTAEFDAAMKRVEETLRLVMPPSIISAYNALLRAPWYPDYEEVE